MKILFVFKCDFDTQPVGIMTLAAVLKNHGHICDFLDVKFENQLIKKIKKINPDIIAYSIVSFDWLFFRDLNLKIKKKFHFFSFFGGPHCSIYPEFINEEGVDALCIGEGEYAFLELADKMQKGEIITDIKNLWVKKEGRIHKNEIRPLVEDLNTLPFPDQEILRKYQFYRHFGTFYVLTSRGCKYNCPYCINHFYKKLYHDKGTYLRQRSVENVIDELLILKNTYKAKLIVFADEVFVLNKEWLIRFAKEYIKYINLPFEAYVRIELITPEILALLKEMGCIEVYFGIETGNEAFRKKTLNRNMSNETIIKNALLIKKSGIETMAFNMMGIPDETLALALETLHINALAKITYPLCLIFQPFPNLELTHYAMSKGSYDGNINGFNKSLTNGRPLIISADKKKIERLQLLFAAGVIMPWLIPLIKLLIKIPLSPLYSFIYFFSKAHILIFKLKRPFPKQFLLYILKFGLYKTAPFLIKK